MPQCQFLCIALSVLEFTLVDQSGLELRNMPASLSLSAGIKDLYHHHLAWLVLFCLWSSRLESSIRASTVSAELLSLRLGQEKEREVWSSGSAR